MGYRGTTPHVPIGIPTVHHIVVVVEVQDGEAVTTGRGHRGVGQTHAIQTATVENTVFVNDLRSLLESMLVVSETDVDA